MKGAFYTDLWLKNLNFDQARAIYVEWVLGIKRFGRSEQSRRDVGINPRWSMRELHDGATLIGHHDARVWTRPADGRFLLHMVHRDTEIPSEFWHNVVELTVEKEGVRVRHACGRSGAPGRDLKPKAAAPGVIRRLLLWNGHRVEPLGVGDASVVKLEAETASETLKYLVLDASSPGNFVLVTSTIEGENPLVDPDVLARRLAGLARVIFARNDEASRAFTHALQAKGFPRQFATMDGGVRLFRPTPSPEHSPYDHPLWTRARLETYGPDRVDALAGEIAELAVRGLIPRFFFESIVRFDREQQDRRVAEMLDAARKTGDDDIDQLRAVNEGLRQELEAQRVAVKALEGDLEAASDLLDDEVRRRVTAEQQADEMREAADRARAKAEALARAVENSQDGEGLGERQREALAAVVEGRTPTPRQCLDALVALYGDHIVVLGSAYQAAEKSARFKHGDRLWELLLKLATEYRQRMLTERGGDNLAKQVFGNTCFAAKESETTMNNERARRERTFVHDEQHYIMWRHLKIGVKDSAEDSIRVHYEWVGDEGIIVIGHCGEHLYLPSFG